MKKILFLSFITLFFISCSSQLLLKTRTNRLIEKSYKNSDTVYMYSFSSNTPNLIWYYKDEFMYHYYVYPNKTIKYKPIEAINISINDSIDNYFDFSIYKDIPCFYTTLDGSYVCIFVKEKGYKCTSLQEDCLLNSKYDPNSFPYKLQHDLSILFKERGVKKQ